MKVGKQKQDKIFNESKNLQKGNYQTLPNRRTPSKQTKANKQNNKEISSSLQRNTPRSKQFTLSDTIKTGVVNKINRKDLKQIKENHNQYTNQMSTKCQEKDIQQIFERRLSLKCTNNYSQQLDLQKSQRYSMIPLKKQSSATLPSAIQQNEEKQSLYTYQVSSAITESKTKNSLKKQVIITNLMNKLDHQEDLRMIIQAKLKNGNAAIPLFGKERKNHQNFDYHQQNMVSSKLKQYENELSYYKFAIKQMSEKILDLTAQKNMFETERPQQQQILVEPFTLKNDLITLIRLLQKSHECQSILKRQTKNVGVQTINNEQLKQDKNNKTDLEFMENIDKTLKILTKNH